MDERGRRAPNKQPFLFPIPGVRSGGIRYDKIVEIGKGIPEKTNDGRYRLPKGWIAIKSLFKQGRVFYYNVETHRSSWVRPLQADFVEEEEYELASVDSRALVTWTSHVDEDAKYVPGTSSIREIRHRSVEHEEKAIDFQEAMMKVGPGILLAKIMLVNTEYYFERWEEYTKNERKRKALLMLWMATKLQAYYRGWKLRKELEAIKIARIKAIKAKDFPDIRDEIQGMYDDFNDDEKAWFDNLKKTLPFKGMKKKEKSPEKAEKKLNYLQMARQQRKKKRYE
jgi:hypothetical protein